MPSVLLIPLLAFDSRGKRLGYGGGFYDRTLALWPGAVRIGCAFAAQEIDSVPTGPYDQRLHAVVTEAGPKGHGSSPTTASASSATKAAAPSPEQAAINTVWKACAYGEFDRVRDYVDANPSVVHQVSPVVGSFSALTCGTAAASATLSGTQRQICSWSVGSVGGRARLPRAAVGSVEQPRRMLLVPAGARRARQRN